MIRSARMRSTVDFLGVKADYSCVSYCTRSNFNIEISQVKWHQMLSVWFSANREGNEVWICTIPSFILWAVRVVVKIWLVDDIMALSHCERYSRTYHSTLQSGYYSSVFRDSGHTRPDVSSSAMLMSGSAVRLVSMTKWMETHQH